MPDPPTPGVTRSDASDVPARDVLGQLSDAGVSIWLDDMSRERLICDTNTPGSLAELARDSHVVGVTTNPTIFQKALSHGTAYDAQVRDLAVRGVDVGEAIRAVTAYDVRAACDVLVSSYQATGGRDGRVSIEVDPRIAHHTERTVAEARTLWWLVDRPNLFIKIPATVEGLPAISQCLAEGISINVTLIFSLARYDAVLLAFLDGLERYRAAGGDLSSIESVASFFVSRVDTEIDQRLDKIGSDAAKGVRGKAAIANARLAYRHYEQILDSPRWQALAAAGARPQRPLWASTGVKDPAYDDTRYVLDLVAPDTVNTMPEATLHAVAEHGVFREETVRGHYGDAQAVLETLAGLGVDYDDVVRVLEDEGVEKFDASWNALIDSMRQQLDLQRGDTPVEPGTAR